MATRRREVLKGFSAAFAGVSGATANTRANSVAASESEASDASFGYRPRGMAMWDAWCLPVKNQVHLYYLQRLVPGSSRTQREADSLGHAVSSDLIHWEERPVALVPGKAGGLEDLQHYTGCALESDGKFYLFYTMRSSRDNGARQRIGVAMSTDCDHWESYAGNPIIEPDPRWYVSAQHAEPGGVVDCRDLLVIRAPDNKRWLGFYAIRVPCDEMSKGGAIATVHSQDLLHWEHLPPAWAPKRFACLEVPDVFPLGNRWYMTCLAGHEYGNRGIFSDPGVVRGTVFAVADRPEGPYKELPSGNILMGGDAQTAYSCRNVVFQGERHILSTVPIPGGPAILSPPRRLRVSDSGALQILHSPHTDIWRKETLIDFKSSAQLQLIPNHYRWTALSGHWQAKSDGVYLGNSSSGWQIAALDARAPAMELESQFKLTDGSAGGFAWGPLNQSGRTQDVLFIFDVERQSVYATQRPWFQPIVSSRFLVQRNRIYFVRLMIRPPRAELFIDDVMTLQFALPQSAMVDKRPALGLFVDRGQVIINNLRIFALRA